MPWFCASSNKKRNKAKIENISLPKSESLLSNGQPTFTVALQDFDASIRDELSSQRGQVLEALYSDGEWIYARNVDGKCGYIPESFCYPLDATNESLFKKNVVDSTQQRPRPKSLHLNIVPTTEEGSLSSVGLHQQVRPRSHEQFDSQPRTSTPVPPQTSTSVTPNTILSHPSSSPNPNTHGSIHRQKICSNGSEGRQESVDGNMIGDICTKNTFLDGDNNVGGHVYQTLEQATSTVPHVISISSAALVSTPDNVLSHNTTFSHPNTPITKSAVHQRRRSCPSERIASDITPVVFPARSHASASSAEAKPKGVRRSVSLHEGAHCKATLEMCTHLPPSQRTMSYQEAVYLPLEKRNQNPQQRLSSTDSPGCSRKDCDCSRPQRFPRRIRDREQYSDSAVCHDSDDVFLPETESKRPYGIYRCRQDYEPKFKGEITLHKDEMVIVLDYGKGEWAWIVTSNNLEGLIPKQLLVRYNVNRHASKNKTIDATTQTELLIASTVRHVSSASSASGGQSVGCSPSEQGSQESEGVARSVLAPTSIQTDGSPEWFRFGDSLERPAKSASCTTPVSTSVQGHKNGSQHLSSRGHTNRLKQDKQSNQESTQCQQGTPVLAATRDYEPPTDRQNCLALKKGDVLTPQTHMYFPKGWMWVWHTGLRTFGYVPSKCVMYTYCVPKNLHRRTDTIEDEV